MCVRVVLCVAWKSTTVLVFVFSQCSMWPSYIRPNINEWSTEPTVQLVGARSFLNRSNYFLTIHLAAVLGRIEMDNSELHSEHKHQSIQMLATVRARSILFLFWWHICIGILYRCLVAIELHGDVILFAVCVCCFFFYFFAFWMWVSAIATRKVAITEIASPPLSLSLSLSCASFKVCKHQHFELVLLACLPACLPAYLLACLRIYDS